MSSVQQLQEWCKKDQLKRALVADGKVSVGDSILDMSEIIEIKHEGKTVSYSVGSVFLRIMDADGGLIKYRNACKEAGVKDPIKAGDRKIVVGFFFQLQPRPAEAPPVTEKKEDDRRSHEKDRQQKDRKRKKAPSGHAPKGKKPKEMTNEELLVNLNVVVDKREAAGINLEVHQALSAVGFDVPSLTPEGQKQAEGIMSLEIPVGNSASILRPAPGRNFRKALELYQDTVDKKKKSSKPPPPTGRVHLRGKKPIIVLPKGMQPPLTMLNAHEFFANRRFVPRDAVLARKRSGGQKVVPPTTFKHMMDVRNGGGVLEFELMDNPKGKLGNDPKAWDRIVAVISLGASWQFKDWPHGYGNPVNLFQRAKGFYVAMEGDKTPSDVMKWRVVHSKLNRSNRGLDSVSWANFWKTLEEFMAVHKREMLPIRD